jgi:hypothetical protein
MRAMTHEDRMVTIAENLQSWYVADVHCIH